MSSGTSVDVTLDASLKNKISILRELRESVKSTSEHTQKQIENIDKHNLLITTVTLIIYIATGIGVGLIFGLIKKIAVYWIPASFLLWFLWLSYGIVLILITVSRKNSNQIEKSVNNDIEKKIMMDWFNKILLPPTIGISILYLITFGFLILIQCGIFEVTSQANLFIPLLTSVIFISATFVLKYQKNSNSERKFTSIWILFAIFMVFGIAFLLPFFALINTIQNIPNFYQFESLMFFCIIEICQIFLVLLLASSISGIIASKEMSKIINDLAQIDSEITNFILNNHEIKEDSIQKIKNWYQSTKKYDVEVMWLFIFKTYTIAPSPSFVKYSLKTIHECQLIERSEITEDDVTKKE